MKQRIITGVIGGAAIITLLYIGGFWLAALLSLFALIGFYELIRMTKITFWSIPSIIGLLTTVGLTLTAYLGNKANPVEQLALHIDFTTLFISIALFLFSWIVISKNEFTIEDAGVILLGILYAGFGFYSFLDIRLNRGFDFVLFVLLMIWVTDSGALFTGKYLGKHKLWPSISPNKTIEGAVGGSLAAVAASLIFESIYPVVHSFSQAILLAVIISMAGQLGDLVESAIKRHYNVKDSGQIIPGHGGVLDRFDSLLFVFSILYVLQHVLELT